MENSNPLAIYMRQPKIYIRLPSNGNFWAPGSLELSETGDYPVYSMTAKDELALKVPDALMNGQAVVDVIQHCVPNIKNAWACPSLDIDTILIAIRLATYGEMMTTPVKIQDLELEYQVDLRTIMDQLVEQIRWDSTVPITDELTVFVKPLTYKNISQAAIQSFETQKIMDAVNDAKMTDEQKIALFKDSFAKMTNATLGTIIDSIDRVDSINGSTDDPAHIKDFINNIDKEIYTKIEKHLATLREQNNIKPMRVAVTDEMKEKGLTSEFIEIPITFDPSTFFV
jgi:hypothetical protein